MYEFRHAGRHASRAVRFWRWPSMLLAAAWLPFAAGASCLENPDPELHRLQDLVSEDGTKALRQAQSELDALQRGPLRDARANASRRAALYAIQAHAYGILELDGKAREAAAKGLALATGEHDPVHLELLSAYAESVYDKAGIAERHRGGRGGANAPAARFGRRYLPAHDARLARAPAGSRRSGDRHPDPGISREHRPRRDRAAHHVGGLPVPGHAQHGRLQRGAGAQPGEDRLGRLARTPP